MIRFLLLACLVLWGAAATAQPLTPEDRQAYKSAFAASRGGDWESARRLAAGAREPLLAKVLLWQELMRNRAQPFEAVVAFADANPDWPLVASLRQRAEEASGTVPDALLLPYFQRVTPTLPEARLRFADLLAAAGQANAAQTQVRDLWIGGDLTPELEAAILARFAGALRAEDHVARLDRLLWDGQSAAARRQLARVPDEWRRLGEARLALAANDAAAETLLAQVPERLRADPGLTLDRARALRRRDMLADAAMLLRNAPPLVRPNAWWSERNVVARRLVDLGEARLAYEVAAGHGLPPGGAEFADAEFLAGWIALRRLFEPTTALEHFTRLHGAVKMPVSLARGAYWAGRAAEAQGDAEAARRWYGTAADLSIAFYGQLAAARLGVPANPRFPPEPVPPPDLASAFDGRELVRTARLLAEIGEAPLAKPFLLRVSATAKSAPEQKLVSDLAGRIGLPDVALAASRRAGADGVPWLLPGYPVLPVPSGVTEAPLVLAITRQESTFDKGAISRSDARGLMQLLPGTAKDVAKSLKLPFSADRLTGDAGYNLTLGHAYLDRMLESFSGSYVLAIAAYNAGPARVRQWLGAYGDPREAGDVLDWIERIPFNETRNYVQRVLENLQIYRMRLGDKAQAFTLPQDLRR